MTLTEITSALGDRWLTVPELADYLGLSRSSAWALVRSGHIESMKLGPKSRRVHASAVGDYLRRCEVGVEG